MTEAVIRIEQNEPEIGQLRNRNDSKKLVSMRQLKKKFHIKIFGVTSVKHKQILSNTIIR